MQCCGTWNTGCCPQHHPNIVTFDNLKTKYSVNEDIHIEYTLHGHVQQASTRDWLGIFPRGWTNLQQYLTFEYALVAPRAAASSNRTIIFPRVFHQEAFPNIEYQLVYVSREIQVLATSPYFRFIREDKIGATTQVLHVPCRTRVSSSDKPEIYPDQVYASGWAPPHIVLSDQSLSSIRPSGTIPANPRLFRSCRSCCRPREHVCGLAVGRARFLATHNASLAKRVARLEQDLALAESTRRSLAERLQAYEGFVGELLRSVATKRVVRITDASGKEIVLQQLQSTNVDTDVEIIEEPMKTGKEKKKEQTSDPEMKNDPPAKKEPFTDHFSKDDALPLRDDQCRRRTHGDLTGDCKENSAVNKKWISTDAETQTRLYSDTKCTEEISKAQNYEDTIEVLSCNEKYNKKEQARIEVSENEISETLENVADEGKEVPGKRDSTDDENDKSRDLLDEGSKILQSKPSAIVIQGSSVKFAIIRY